MNDDLVLALVAIDYRSRMGCFNCSFIVTRLDLIQHPPTSLCIKR